MKYFITGKYTDKATGIEHLHVGTPPPATCKECKKEPRKQGSSRCDKCSELFKKQKANQARLNRKIAEQAKL